MKAYIKTECGNNIGFGHLTRCLSLSQALENKDIACYFDIVAKNSASDFLKKQRIKFVSNNSKGLPNRIKGFDIAVVDSYKLPKKIYEGIAKSVKLGVYIDDYNRLRYPKGIVLNSSIYANRFSYYKNNNIKYLLGTKFSPLRKEFSKVARKRINDSIKKVLITFGGIKNEKFLGDLVYFLTRNFDFKIDVILPYALSKPSCFFNSYAKRVKFYINAGAKLMKKLMLASDLCISGGGQTIYELACCGVPTIGISFAYNQALNLKSWQKIGFLRFAGLYKDKNLFSRFERYIREMDYRVRLIMSRTGKKFIDGQGAKRVSAEIIKCVYEK